MKNLIKTHYKDPEVDPKLLTKVLSQHAATKIRFSFVNMLSVALLMFVTNMFIKHLIGFNLSYIDVNLSLYNWIGIPFLFALNVALALIQFITHNILMLTLMGLLIFTLNFIGILKKS